MKAGKACTDVRISFGIPVPVEVWDQLLVVWKGGGGKTNKFLTVPQFTAFDIIMKRPKRHGFRQNNSRRRLRDTPQNSVDPQQELFGFKRL